MKTLALVSTGYVLPPEVALRALEQQDLHPRASLFRDSLGADLLDERRLRALRLSGTLRAPLYRALPDAIAQVIEAYTIRHDYDAVVSWAERLALPLAALLKATNTSVPHVAIVGWISKPKKAWLLKAVHTHIDRIVTGASTQRDFAIHHLGIPPHKVKHVHQFVDQKFFRPMEGDPDMICAVGREMRDYPTLIEALRPLGGLRCHIAAGAHRGKVERWVRAIDDVGALPDGTTVGKLGYNDLRDLYARSRFVVVPLLQTDTDNGVTTILEAMAMGKAVICTRTRGQVDVIEENVTGVFVPPGDAKALRSAIRYLCDHPAEAKRMGLAGRKRVEERHTIDQYMSELRVIVEDAIAEHGLAANRRPNTALDDPTQR